MEIHTLCDEIQLQPEIKSPVIEFSNAFDPFIIANAYFHTLDELKDEVYNC